MQISIETTTQSASVFTASFGQGQFGNSKQAEEESSSKAPAVSLLESAADKAEEDAVVIAALREAVEKGREEGDEEKTGLATVEDYQNTAGKLKSALGVEEAGEPNVTYESGTTTTTTIEAQIGDQTISAEFVSYERVSYSSETGLSVRRASASNIEGNFGDLEFSQQRASVSSLYAGSGTQLSNLAELTA
ncbi:hypothetical protein TRICHSKD4_1727 [Roseibium sp. TrichSKD4]|uniref:hypothetical protein n=1 Tax=Roseibium sp. TrichSKD4 TaxID=744980 RepID=UPI0001E56443|nr:hypothetical protein [Roseibium sp. TrichSKD4]EFO33103.1 hypothetical protein TRICHSKD4_1727 [Roseibium sp. TrichSKD4]